MVRVAGGRLADRAADRSGLERGGGAKQAARDACENLSDVAGAEVPRDIGKVGRGGALWRRGARSPAVPCDQRADEGEEAPGAGGCVGADGRPILVRSAVGWAGGGGGAGRGRSKTIFEGEVSRNMRQAATPGGLWVMDKDPGPVARGPRVVEPGNQMATTGRNRNGGIEVRSGARRLCESHRPPGRRVRSAHHGLRDYLRQAAAVTVRGALDQAYDTRAIRRAVSPMIALDAGHITFRWGCQPCPDTASVARSATEYET